VWVARQQHALGEVGLRLEVQRADLMLRRQGGEP
jgi:hypothetical protein